LSPEQLVELRANDLGELIRSTLSGLRAPLRAAWIVNRAEDGMPDVEWGAGGEGVSAAPAVPAPAVPAPAVPAPACDWLWVLCVSASQPLTAAQCAARREHSRSVGVKAACHWDLIVVAVVDIQLRKGHPEL
jgi:hypothetical protein